jgi:hypothetical protein
MIRDGIPLRTKLILYIVLGVFPYPYGFDSYYNFYGHGAGGKTYLSAVD